MCLSHVIMFAWECACVRVWVCVCVVCTICTPHIRHRLYETTSYVVYLSKYFVIIPVQCNAMQTHSRVHARASRQQSKQCFECSLSLSLPLSVNRIESGWNPCSVIVFVACLSLCIVLFCFILFYFKPLFRCCQ